MAARIQFTVQLENYQKEAQNAAFFVYGGMAVQHAASRSKRLLALLNETPTYWQVSAAALQTAAYMCFGRIFDNSSRYNVAALLDAAEHDIALFQRDALAERKCEGRSTVPPWLPDYLDNAYYPTPKDFQRLRRSVEKYRRLYEHVIKPARNKYIAHRERHGQLEVQALFQRGKIRDLWSLTTFLLQLGTVLWELLHNGRKPRFRSVRYSIRSIFDSDAPRSSAHEYIVHDVKKLMQLIEDARLNQPSGGGRGGSGRTARSSTGDE